MYKDPDQRQVFQCQQNIVSKRKHKDRIVFILGAIIKDTNFAH